MLREMSCLMYFFDFAQVRTRAKETARIIQYFACKRPLISLVCLLASGNSLCKKLMIQSNSIPTQDVGGGDSDMRNADVEASNSLLPSGL